MPVKITSRFGYAVWCMMMALMVSLCGATVQAAQEITFWTWASGESLAVENDILNIFREANPNIKLSYDLKSVRNGEALVVAAAGGAAPDLVTTHQDWHSDFAAKGAFSICALSSSGTSSIWACFPRSS